MNFTARINQALEEAPHVTQADLARACGLASASVSNWFTGATKSLKGANLIKVAGILGVSPRWLAEGIGPKHLSETAPAPLLIEDDDAVYASVRTVKLRVSAGIAGFAVDVDEMPGQPIFFRRDWLRLRGFNPAKLHAIKVKGRSMEPTLYAEDMIVFNEADTTPHDGDVFVINFAGEVVVKRLIKEGPVWWMHSDNTDQQRYPRVRCDKHCLLLGRVVHRQSETI